MSDMKILFSILFSVICFSISAQSGEIQGEQREAMIQQINRAASSLKTIVCDFEQTKHLSLLNDKMVSRGKMYYKQDNQLRWEYLAPYKYIFILNGKEVLLKSAQGQNKINIQSNRLFQEIANIMMNSVTGKCLTDESNFKVAMYKDKEDWVARLTPLDKNIKQMFKDIVVYFDPTRSMASKVEIREKSGDMTLIELKNMHSNIAVDEAVFSMD